MCLCSLCYREIVRIISEQLALTCWGDPSRYFYLRSVAKNMRKQVENNLHMYMDSASCQRWCQIQIRQHLCICV